MFLLATLYLVLFIAAALLFIYTLCLYQKAKIDADTYKCVADKYRDSYLKLHDRFYEAELEKDKFGYWKFGYKLREKPLDIKC